MPPGAVTRHASERLVYGVVFIAVIYLGREVLIPITLALILGLLVAPLVRSLRHLRFGAVGSVLVSVVVLCVLFAGIAAVLGLQLAELASQLPQYAHTISAKLSVVQSTTLRRMELLEGEAIRMFGNLSGTLPVTGPLAVEIHEPALTPIQLLSRLLTAAWAPLSSIAIVLIMLVFVLLEHESLRDRFIRLTGGSDLRGTTAALNDASRRLSRYFVSQFMVNAGVGAVLGIGLALIGLPNGALWAVLSAGLRFIPYIGIWMAALVASVLAVAVDPGWSLLLGTVVLYVVVELLAGQAIEPYLYGHSTGLSPLSIVISAIFWGWIWGPVGLLLSTPLTLCLVVAGRYVPALEFIDVLLGDTPALSLSQRFYQRALAGDADEIIATARGYLKRRPLARYCDEILMPAMQLATADHVVGRIASDQRQVVGSTIARVIETLGPDQRAGARRARRATILDDENLGTHLRHQRELALGRWQGPLTAPAGSVVLCVSLGSRREDLVTEILVRILRSMEIDARHLSIADVEQPPESASRESVAMVYVVSDLGTPAALEDYSARVALLRQRLGHAEFVALVPDRPLSDEEQRVLVNGRDLLSRRFEEAVRLAEERLDPNPRHRNS